MSDDVLVSEENTSESGDEIFNHFPPWMPKDESTGNFKLIEPAGRGIDRLQQDISDAEDATNPQTAQSIGQLKKLAKLVELDPKSGESAEKFRRRIIGEFQQTTNEGDLPSLYKNIGVLLDIQASNIVYQESSENGSFILSVPGDSIDRSPLTEIEFGEIIGEQVAAGFRVDIQSRGTFTYLTPTDYTNNNHDSTKGFDGLDSNSDPKDNGGTYAGVLN